MLDLMEMRGFKAITEVGTDYCVTPDGTLFVLPVLLDKSSIQAAFSYFLLLNPQYP